MEPIYEGKAKRLYTTDNPNVLRMEYKDDATAGNGAKKAQFENKGRMNNPDSHSMYWYDTPDLISSVGTMQIQRGAGISTNGTGAFGGAVNMSTARSEERRVGKECRSRWSPYH